MSTTGPRLHSPDADAQGWISVGPKGASLRLEGVEGVELRAASVVPPTGVICAPCVASP